MGMDTGLKVQAVLKEKFVEPMKEVLSTREFSPLLKQLDLKEQQILKSYMTLDRHDHVFSLVGQGKFKNYDNPNEFWDLTVEGPSRIEGNILKVYGSLKNHDEVINRFIEEILLLISEKVISAESWYEESDKPYKR